MNWQGDTLVTGLSWVQTLVFMFVLRCDEMTQLEIRWSWLFRIVSCPGRRGVKTEFMFEIDSDLWNVEFIFMSANNFSSSRHPELGKSVEHWCHEMFADKILGTDHQHRFQLMLLSATCRSCGWWVWKWASFLLNFYVTYTHNSGRQEVAAFPVEDEDKCINIKDSHNEFPTEGGPKRKRDSRWDEWKRTGTMRGNNKWFPYYIYLNNNTMWCGRVIEFSVAFYVKGSSSV